MPEKQMKVCGEEFFIQERHFFDAAESRETAPVWLAWCNCNALAALPENGPRRWLKNKQGETKMKKRILIAFAAALMMSIAVMAQDTMKQGDQMKHDNMKADNMSKKAVSLSGKVSDDGKMFVSDKDNKSFTVGNPEALKGHEGHHVTVKGHLDADKNEIHVTSVKMAKGEMKGEMKDNMKKDEMQH